jgi:hypothetical protein
LTLGAQPTPRDFCAALRAAGCEAGSAEYVYAEGYLPDGRRWDLGTERDFYEGDDEPLDPELLVYVYESEAEERIVSPRWRRISTSGNMVGYLSGTAGQVAGAIARANAGDYSSFTCDDEGPMPEPPEDRPLEGTRAADGTPLFPARVRLYLRTVRSYAGEARWPAGPCPRCGAVTSRDGADLAADGYAAHVTIGGVVALCGPSFTLDLVYPGTTYRPWAPDHWPGAHQADVRRPESDDPNYPLCTQCGASWDFTGPGRARCENGHEWDDEPAFPGTLVRVGHLGDVNDPERYPDNAAEER